MVCCLTLSHFQFPNYNQNRENPVHFVASQSMVRNKLILSCRFIFFSILSNIFHQHTFFSFLNDGLYILQITDEEEAHVITSDNEMFILGLLKEQRQEEKDRERMGQVRNMFIFALFNNIIFL